jgi:hypothetical protein
MPCLLSGGIFSFPKVKHLKYIKEIGVPPGIDVQSCTRSSQLNCSLKASARPGQAHDNKPWIASITCSPSPALDIMVKAGLSRSGCQCLSMLLCYVCCRMWPFSGFSLSNSDIPSRFGRESFLCAFPFLLRSSLFLALQLFCSSLLLLLLRRF